MKEYNELTKKLLAEGYTADNYPDYVKIDTSRFTGDDPLNNMGGGFVYKKHIKDSFVYKTGCGLYVMGEHAFEMGLCIEWRHEDDNPVTHCPFKKANCGFNDKRLRERIGTDICFTCYCVCHRTDEEYNYGNSVEKYRKLKEEEKERKYQEYSDTHNGRVCRNHMYWNEAKEEWELRYSPSQCAHMCFFQNGFCPILNKKLSREKGNVYYDLKESHIRQDDTFFSGETIALITKGIRYFKKPVSMDICKAFIKLESGEIYRRYHWEKESTMQLLDKTFKGEILNIRAESKPSRDLMQDLDDIKNGIEVIHQSDSEKNEKAYKKKKKEDAKRKLIEKLEKKIISSGVDSLDYSEQKKVEKYLSDERICELENLHYENLKREKNKPVQMNLFDIGLERSD